MLLTSLTSNGGFGGTFILIVFLGGVFWLLYLFIKNLISKIGQRARKMAAEIDNTKPGFLEFFVAWDDKKSKEEMMGILKGAGVIAVVSAGAAIITAANESKVSHDEEKNRNAVDDAFKRRGY